MKQVKVDVHTHTIMSGHAFGTLDEMCRAAAEKGIEVYGITEHGPSIAGTCDPIYYSCYGFVPREQYGMKLLLGCEINIIDDKGTLDLDQHYIDYLDIRIAGIHAKHVGRFWELDSPKYNTDAYLACIKNPEIDIISHPDAVDADFDELCAAAKEYHKFLEINAHSPLLKSHRPHAAQNIRRILECAKKYNLEVLMSSDAHYMAGIGDMSNLDPFMEETAFPEELIINYRPNDFLKYIQERRNR